jgi:hypothetical protein
MMRREMANRQSASGMDRQGWIISLAGSGTKAKTLEQYHCDGLDADNLGVRACVRLQ